MQINENVYQAIVIKELKHEARMSDRQIRMLEWCQITDDKQIRTRRNREVKISDELFNAIVSIPVQGRRVFKVRRASLLLEVPECPQHRSTPVITDDKTKLAMILAEKLLS